MQRVSFAKRHTRRGCGVARALGLLIAAAACGPSSPARAPDAATASGESAPAEGAASPAAATPAAEVPEASAPEASAAAGVPAAGATGAGSDDDLDADIAELSASTRSGAAAIAEPKPAAPNAAPGADLSGRNVVYRVTPKGLVIEIDGFHLRPEAKTVPLGSGGYGVEITIRAESFDGRSFWVDTPKEGPLSIAGKVQSKDGKVQRFADERQGSGEEVVLGDTPRTFEQRWPGRGQPKLLAGQTLTLEVGLWGVRAESERERPVRRLFTVKLVAGRHAPAVIEPPAMDWGS